jgi:hypothetical protein
MTSISRMYSATAMPSAPKPIPSAEQRAKAAARVIGGMKAHGTHLQQVMIDDQLVDFPTSRYVQMVEGQVKDLKVQIQQQKNDHTKLLRVISKLTEQIRIIRSELDNKVDLR